MSKSKWIMKQYWRIGTIRSLSSLALSMLVLGRLYYIYIPGLSDLGLLGALILGTFLILLFIGIGTLYDIKGKMWCPKNQALVDRSVYEYVPNIRDLTFDYQIYYTLFTVLKRIFVEIGIETKNINDILIYLNNYYGRNPEKDDIHKSVVEAEKFNNDHPFSRKIDAKAGSVSWIARIKLGFETQVLRISWINNLTGMAQDALVFAAIYIVIIFPDVAVNDFVPVEYMLLGIVVISLPIFFIITAIGWIYDRKLKVWSVDKAVNVERNPYTYIPEIKMYGFIFPVLYGLFKPLYDLQDELGIDNQPIERILRFLEVYEELTLDKDENMQRARDLRDSFGPLFIGGNSIEN